MRERRDSIPAWLLSVEGRRRRKRNRSHSADCARGEISSLELVVIGMRPDPDPIDATLNINAEGAVLRSDSNRPQLADSLEVQRRVPGIRV